MKLITAVFGGGGVGEVVIILVILLLLFGSAKLPKLARSLGSSVTEFRKGLKGEEAKKTLPEGEQPTEASSPAESREEEKTS